MALTLISRQQAGEDKRVYDSVFQTAKVALASACGSSGYLPSGLQELLKGLLRPPEDNRSADSEPGKVPIGGDEAMDQRARAFRKRR